MIVKKEPKYYDVTTWNEKRFFQTKGTRDKCIVQNPVNNMSYYFKTSFNQGDRNYKYEFWSEIIASYIGRYLGFNTLEYNIAKKGDLIGCLSKKMNDDNSSLIEGMSLLTGYDNSYSPKKDSYQLYTLELIFKALNFYKVKQEDFNKMIIFDFIIGNSDRHQENWGFISHTKTDYIHKLYSSVRNKRRLKSFLKWIIPSFIRSKFTRKMIYTQINEFAPIYDSGSSLVRELRDDKIDLSLKDKVMFSGIINRAKSEIRKDNGEKFKQKDIIKEILVKDPSTFMVVKDYLVNRVDKNILRDIIFNIDKDLPNDLNDSSLPYNRKQLIYKLVCERIDIIKNM
jgi:hypothetical protein